MALADDNFASITEPKIALTLSISYSCMNS